MIEDFKEKVKVEGFWNFFLFLEVDFEKKYGVGLINVEYVYLCEFMGMFLYVFEVCNCFVFDMGNMELLVRYGIEV